MDERKICRQLGGGGRHEAATLLHGEEQSGGQPQADGGYGDRHNHAPLL